MTLHTTEIAISVDGQDIECIPAEFEIDQSFDDYSHPDSPCSDMRGGYTAELLNIKLGGLKLDRNAIEQMTSLAMIQHIEEMCAEELDENLE